MDEAYDRVVQIYPAAKAYCVWDSIRGHRSLISPLSLAELFGIGSKSDLFFVGLSRLFLLVPVAGG